MAETNEIWDAVKQTKYGRTFEQLHDILSNASKDVDGAVVSTLDVVCNISHSEAGTFWFYDKEKEGLIIPRAVFGGADLSGIRLLPGEGIAGKVIETGEPSIVSDVNSSSTWSKIVDKKTNFNTRSVMCVPLIARDSVFGCIQLINKTDGSYFDDNDLDLAVNIAREISSLCQKYNILVYEKEYEHVAVLSIGMKELANGSEGVEPYDMFKALKTYYSIIEKPILKYGGIISKINYDGVLAYWVHEELEVEEAVDEEAAEEHEDELIVNDSVLKACKAANEILSLREAMQNEIADKYQVGFGVSIGITYGNSYIGDVGTKDTSNYTIVGQNVNLARALQEQANSGDIYVDENAAGEVSDGVSFSKVKRGMFSHGNDVYKIEGFKNKF